MDDLTEKIGEGYSEADCNVDFESEMVIGVCTRLPCSGPLASCDVKSLNDKNLARFLQPYTCQEENGESVLTNHFLVVPKTSRNITVEVHRYYSAQEEEEDGTGEK
jgi:hypothetical protein